MIIHTHTHTHTHARTCRVEGVKDNTAYELDNIDLGGFEIKTDNVTVTLLDGSILILGNKVSLPTM